MKLFKGLTLLLAFCCLSGYKGQIQVNAVVDHIEPWVSDYQGGINISTTGGTPVYSYTWNQGPGQQTTQNLSNIVKSQYRLKVKDSSPDSVYYYYNVGYKTRWMNFYGSKFRNDSLMSNGVGGFVNRTALTKNTLLNYANGWVEYIHQNPALPYVLGFLDSASVASLGNHNDYDFAFHVASGNNLYAFSSGNFTWLGTVNYGDVLKAERTGTLFTLSVNSVVTYTDVALFHKKLKVKGLLLNDPLVNIGVSFQDTLSLEKLSYLNVAVDHVNTDGIDSLGNITLKLNDGYPPFKYYWNPGSIYTRDLNDKTQNTYSIKVKDSRNDSVSYSYKLGYKALWNEFYGTFSRNDSVISTGTGSYLNRSAVTKNTLWSNTNGWAEMVTQPFLSSYVVGFLDSTYTPSTHVDYDFAWHVTTGSALYAYSSGGFTLLGIVKTGDVITIDRTGTVFTLKINGVSTYTDVANPGKKLKVKAQILNDPLVNIGTSFKDTVSLLRLNRINAFVDHANLFGSSNGNIYLKISRGYPPYTYTWTPGSINTRDLANSAQNSYTVKVKDSYSDSVTYRYSLGKKMLWTNLYGTLANTDSLKSNGIGAYTDRTALSINKLAASTNGWVELVIQEYTSPSYLVGFLDTAYAANIGDLYDIDFAFHLTTGNALYAWSGGSFYYLGSANEGDAIRIERTSSTYSLSRNGTVLHTAAATAAQTLRVKAVTGGAGVVPIARLGASFGLPLSVNSVSAQTHYAILKKKLDGGYYNTIPNGSSNETFYFMFEEEYYNPNTNNLSYTIVDNNNSSSYTVPNLVRKIGDNRFALDVTTISPALSTGYYRIYIRNEKNEVWQARIKVN
ncbi:MAG: hypothetical protein K0S32_903 [Bacteroidetes bacterium]|jgi:hypothetical protein|nr:hypothetical protein [Bacteroidota bacterium]